MNFMVSPDNLFPLGTMEYQSGIFRIVLVVCLLHYAYSVIIY